jgi:hypothetical protein
MENIILSKYYKVVVRMVGKTSAASVPNKIEDNYFFSYIDSNKYYLMFTSQKGLIDFDLIWFK